MKKSDIRPFSIYIGHGGVTRKVKFIYMAVDGSLFVQWRLIRSRGQSEEQSESVQPIDEFARWAKALKQTLSRDLEHHLSKQ
ncbi:hypothetical protein DXT88_19615 [Herbaspirillum lusitanum]|uniref:hypothetical protein n=1 Tax=Herbaspirillum lusitanum TaxID=213312 RepID=UPI002237B631|nr:hypothetical protein [Herbaspirillum lusitanum]MCW5300385.1 hypothetical protein [Herbaspirillum lusitanum]